MAIKRNTQEIKGIKVIKNMSNDGFHWFVINDRMSKIVSTNMINYSHKQAYEMFIDNGFIYNTNF